MYNHHTGLGCDASQRLSSTPTIRPLPTSCSMSRDGSMDLSLPMQHTNLSPIDANILQQCAPMNTSLPAKPRKSERAVPRSSIFPPSVVKAEHSCLFSPSSAEKEIQARLFSPSHTPALRTAQSSIFSPTYTVVSEQNSADYPPISQDGKPSNIFTPSQKANKQLHVFSPSHIQPQPNHLPLESPTAIKSSGPPVSFALEETTLVLTPFVGTSKSGAMRMTPVSPDVLEESLAKYLFAPAIQSPETLIIKNEEQIPGKDPEPVKLHPQEAHEADR